jgi:SAM-dependent methyltransferase
MLRRILRIFFRNDQLWHVLNATLLRFARFAQRERKRCHSITFNTSKTNLIAKISPDLTVQNGPFKGMQYPESVSVCSELLPKLLGSYEFELSQILEQICAAGYSDIVDIGCAEGYYAVGLAMRIPEVKVFAFDVDREAIRLCQQMAQANNVSSRVIISSFCSKATLTKIPFTGKGLVISDCEGYEKELFTEETAVFLGHHDLLIETHDFIDISISSYLHRIFTKTHDIELIQSIDDIQKAQKYAFKEIEEFDLDTRRVILAERRPAITQWLFMRPRKLSAQETKFHKL